MSKAITPDQWQRVEALYRAAYDAEPRQRAELMAGADPDVRREVERLLKQASHQGPLDGLAADLLKVVGGEDTPTAYSFPSMRLEPGTSLGPFIIVAALGAGGMGEVYSARDTKLGRVVALKVLPQRFSSDPERLARLRREARVLASLNQPNIASIYGLEESDDVQALVLELVEGPTLADRIARGPVPPDEALRLARQIADALEAAHEMGIIHRDLKPSNIKVRHDGTVKVLDFGLAKALDPVLGRDDETAPTITAPMGTILGTAAYMSPERTHGQAADRRDDIWAFGCVLYEMLTGRAAFTGRTISEIVSEVLKSDPDWSRLPPETPPAIRRLLRRCAQKDRKHRLHDIADARLELDEATSGSQDDFRTVQTATTKRRRERFVFLSVLALATMLATVQSARLWRQASLLPMAPEMRLEINTLGAPEGTLGEPSYSRSLALSPDGLKIVFSATSEGRSQLWLRSLDSVTSRPLAGTDLAVLPFWSPDSRTVGFFADGQLKRIDIDGGTIQTLANAPFGRGGAWTHDGTILFAPLFSGPIFRIRATGGEAAALTQLERPQKDHRLPQFLPDGRRFIYHATDPAETSGVYISRLDGSMTSRLLDAEMAVIHRDTGQLLFLRQGTLFAQPFDPDGSALTGTPSPMAEKVAVVSASDAGPIAYRAVAAAAGARRQFVWFDRTGKEIGSVGNPDNSLPGDPAFSPDGRYVALHRSVDGNPDIWLLEIARGVLTRFTSDKAANYSPRWSPDGRRLVFNSDRSGVFDLYVKPATGAGSEELLLATPQSKSVTDWSPDGRFLLFRSVDPATGHDLWALPLEADRKPFPVIRTSFVEPYGQFSPDGKWVAYQSNESGRPEVYVQSFPDPGARVQISTNGGAQMRWRRDGKELFYIALDGRLMAAPIARGPEGGLEAREPVPLFATNVGEVVPLQSGYNQSYIISPDGQRFLMSMVIEEARPSPITVILNWRPRIQNESGR